MATWRVASSLDLLLKEINTFAPNRSKASDGSIGDAAHASRSSDHNPYIKDSNGVPVVRARDFTHDPARGFDSYEFARSLAKSNDPRIRYIISNGEIYTPSVARAWRKYNGSNPHDHHAHVSVSETEALFDSMADWKWEAGYKATPGDRPLQLQITDPVLKRGAKGDDVHRLQTLLGIKVDGDFGPATERAVKAFQTSRSLTSDGIVGLYTWRALKAAPRIITTDPVAALPVPKTTFDRVMEYVFDDEGGITISEVEPGGASNMGISLETLGRYLGRKASLEELKLLTKQKAKEIYKKLYWDAINADKIATGLNYAAFDFAVNSGVSTVDQIGMDDYLTKALKEATVDKEIDTLMDLRLERMQKNPHWGTYGRGWANRINRVRVRAHTLAA